MSHVTKPDSHLRAAARGAWHLGAQSREVQHHHPCLIADVRGDLWRQGVAPGIPRGQGRFGLEGGARRAFQPCVAAQGGGTDLL